jgi:CRISPR-associated protein Cst2
MTNDRISKAIVLGMLFRVNIANPNAGWTEETVTSLKKIETPDNQRYPYISGQAERRYLRDTIASIVETGENGEPVCKFSPQEAGSDPKSPVLTAGRPDLYIDDDLFGFMRAVKGGTRRRESPLRIAAAIALFPYTGDRDLGTRSALQVTNNPEKGGAIFETEITNNIFHSTWLLELDRVGFWHGYENANTSVELDSTGNLSLAERKTRVNALLRAMKYLTGGARQARLLIDLVPQFVIYARMTKKIPLFLHALSVTSQDGQYDLKKDPLMDVIKDYAGDIQSLHVGMREGFVTTTRANLFANIQETLGTERSEHISPGVNSVGEAVDLMVADINKATF